jgi:molybdopterin/thiamine biosynthesis adenylyltransferase
MQASPTVPIPPLDQFQRKLPSVSPPSLRWKRWKPRRACGEETLSEIPAAWREDRRALHQKCVVVMGLGAVGGVCFEQLARLGVGRLYGFDPDRYGEASWITQPSLARHEGRFKVDIQGRRAAHANPWGTVSTAAAFAQDVPLAVLRQADAIVIAGDNLELLVWAGEYAAGLGKPVVQGAVHGPTQQAIVRGFDLSQADAVCPCCLIAKHEWSRTTSRIGCDPGRLKLQGLEPTQTLPHVCAVAGQMAAGETIKWLLGKNDAALAGAEVQFNLDGYRSLRTNFVRKENCRGPHRGWRIVEVEQSPPEATLRRLARSLSGRMVTRGASDLHWLVKAEIPWIARGSCWSCGKVHPIRRFSRLGCKVARCNCGGVIWADLEGRRSVVPSEDLLEVFDKPLAKLGLRPGDSLAICKDEEWTWFVLS